MGLFKRKQSGDDVPVRCPNCHEHVPQGERECTMCGQILADVLAGDASSATADAGRARPPR